MAGRGRSITPFHGHTATTALAAGNPPQIGDERRARLRAAEAKWRQQHAEKMNALRGFLLDQMRHAVSQ